MCTTVRYEGSHTGLCKSPVTLPDFQFKLMTITQKGDIETKTTLNSFITVFTIYLLNVAAFSLDNPIQTRLKPFANFMHIILPLWNPHTVDWCFQLVHIAVVAFASLTLNVRPNAEIKQVQIRRIWGSEVHLWLQSLLDYFCGVSWCFILLEDILSLFVIFLTHGNTQNLFAIRRSQPITSGEPNRRHLPSIGHHNPEHHHRGWMFCGSKCF